MENWAKHLGLLLLTFLLAGSAPRLRSAETNSLDTAFNPGAGANALVYSLALQPDGKILVAGAFTEFAGQPRYRLVRLNPDGTLDSSFHTADAPNDRVMCVARQSDGKILISGEFTAIGATPRNRVARLNEDGTLDPAFDPGVGSSDPSYNFIYAIAPHLDGKVLVGGTFTQFNGQPHNRIVRLNADGTLDETFQKGSGAEDHWIGVIKVQPDNKIILAGWFTRFNNVGHSRVVRLNPDGTTDASFQAQSDSSVYSIGIQPDGKILLAGHFVKMNGEPRSRVARVNADGSLDPSFNPRGGANDWVQVVMPLADGRIFINGYFTSFDGTARGRTALLENDGALNLSFEANADSYVYCAIPQPDGKILIGGDYTTVNSTPRRGIARIDLGGTVTQPPTPPAVALGIPVVSTNNVQITFPTAPGWRYTVEFKNALTDANWNALQSLISTGATHTVTDGGRRPNIRFYRARVEAVTP